MEICILCLTFQGKFYLLIEELSQLFRALVPIQLWFKYIMGEDPSSSYFLGATLIIIYSLCKVVYLILPVFLQQPFKKDLYVHEINFMWCGVALQSLSKCLSELIIEAIFSVRVCVALNLQFCSVSVI